MWTGPVAHNLVNTAVLFFSFSLSLEKWVAGWLGAILLPTEAATSAQHGGEHLWRQGGQRAMGRAAGQHQKLKNTHTVWLCKWPGSESLCIVSVIYSWRSLSFSKMWKSSLLSSMETYGEAMWQNVQKAQSSSILLLSMAIPSLSLVLQGCLVASTALFTLPTMKRFLKLQALQRETSFTNSSIILITGTTLVVATGALQ